MAGWVEPATRQRSGSLAGGGHAVALHAHGAHPRARGGKRARGTSSGGGSGAARERLLRALLAGWGGAAKQKYAHAAPLRRGLHHGQKAATWRGRSALRRPRAARARCS